MNLLIIDDEKNLRKSLGEYCRMEGMDVEEAANALSARKILEDRSFDAIVVDLKMPGMSGLEFLGWMKEEGPDIPCIMMSAFGEVNDAVTALKAGAEDYLVKPFDPEELVLRLAKITEERRVLRLVEEGSGKRDDFLVSRNKTMHLAYQLLEKAAPSDTTLLITGESGTGKEVAARFVHDKSLRKNGPFMAINIGGVPETLLESELFGYEKGAFTGADRRKSGLFELANGGTLFLDELGDLPVLLQVKLLRVLQERKLQRLGGIGLIPIDVRIVAATNKNLEEAVLKGEFREDLYYRLNVISVVLPPLRERTEDIPELAGFLLARLARRMGVKPREISSEVISLMQNYPFQGNIRELDNMLERAMILGSGDILKGDDFPVLSREPEISGKSGQRNYGTLKEMEQVLIREALLRNEGHREKAAVELGISRRTLLNKMNEYELEWKEN